MTGKTSWLLIAGGLWGGAALLVVADIMAGVPGIRLLLPAIVFSNCGTYFFSHRNRPFMRPSRAGLMTAIISFPAAIIGGLVLSRVAGPLVGLFR